MLGTPEVFDDALRPVMEISTEVWDATMRVNLRGPWLVCRYAIPHMARGGGGSIINTASLAAVATMPVSGAYSVSKGGREHALAGDRRPSTAGRASAATRSTPG